MDLGTKVTNINEESFFYSFYGIVQSVKFVRNRKFYQVMYSVSHNESVTVWSDAVNIMSVI